MRDHARIAVYLAVIAIAPTLQEPWMIALQAAMGGLMLGTRLEQWLAERKPRNKKPPAPEGPAGVAMRP